MCTGRVDLSFVLRALQGGADGVIIGGCWPGECHYVTEGNYDALANMHLCKKLLGHIGLDPDRLRLEWISAAEGARFAEIMSDFAAQLTELGPAAQARTMVDIHSEALRVAFASRPWMLKCNRRELLEFLSGFPPFAQLLLQGDGFAVGATTRREQDHREPAQSAVDERAQDVVEPAAGIGKHQEFLVDDLAGFI